jgi:hypothetical protein
MLQIFIKGLKPEIKNEKIKKLCVSLAQVFDKAEELKKSLQNKRHKEAKPKIEKEVTTPKK